MGIEKDDHHMIPISIGGPDKKSNIITLPTDIHKSIHKILEGRDLKSKVEYDRYSKKTLNNGGLVTPSIVSRENDKQIRYFEKYPELIIKYPELNNKYINAIKELLNEYMIFVEIWEGINNIDNIPNFEQGHIMYCDAKLVWSYLNLHIINMGKQAFLKQIKVRAKHNMPRYLSDNLTDILNTSMPKISNENKIIKTQILCCLNIANNLASIEENKKSEFFDKINTNYLKYIYTQLKEIKNICKKLNEQFIYYNDIWTSNETLETIFGSDRILFQNMNIKISNINKITSHIHDILIMRSQKEKN